MHDVGTLQGDWPTITQAIHTYLRGRVHSKLKLRLLAVVDWQTLHKERREPGAGAAAEAVEDEEALETRALVGLANRNHTLGTTTNWINKDVTSIEYIVCAHAHDRLHLAFIMAAIPS